MTVPVQTASGGASRIVLLLLLACSTLTVMAGATIAPSLPGLLAHFRDVPDATTLVPFILTVPGLAIAVAAPLFGNLVDRVDPKRVLLASVLLYIFAGSSGLFLDGLMPITAGRVLLGFAVGGVMTSAMTLIAILFNGPERGRVLGYQSSAMGFGGVLFILGGGLMADFSWRGPFAMYLVPLVLVPMIWFVLPAINRSAPAPGSVPVDARFPVGLATLIYASAFFLFLIFYMVPTQLPFLFAELGAPRASIAGYAISLITLASAVVSLLYGRVRGAMSFAAITALSFAALGLGFLAVAQTTTIWPLFVIAPFIGASLGLSMPNLTTWLMSQMPLAMRGRASGLMTMSIFLAQFLSAFVGAQLVKIGGLSLAFSGMGLVSLAIGAMFLVLHVTRHRMLRTPA